MQRGPLDPLPFAVFLVSAIGASLRMRGSWHRTTPHVARVWRPALQGTGRGGIVSGAGRKCKLFGGSAAQSAYTAWNLPVERNDLHQRGTGQAARDILLSRQISEDRRRNAGCARRPL